MVALADQLTNLNERIAHYACEIDWRPAQRDAPPGQRGPHPTVH